MTHRPSSTSEPNESPQPESVSPSSPRADRITRWLLTGIGVYTGLLVTLLNVFLLGSGKTIDRAIILMADGLIVFWIIIGGSLTPMLRRRLVPRLAAIPIDWRVRFVLLCTAMALTEEVITTTMTNLAPLFGTTPEEAHITASTNYFTVVCFHSVVVFVPMFIAWAWMLSRWKISPLKTLLLFGITGSIAEAGIEPSNLIGGFWVFVYGLMVYLPACTVPEDRPAKQPRWWHYPLAVVLPFPFVVLAAPMVLLREWLGIEFLPGGMKVEIEGVGATTKRIVCMGTLPHTLLMLLVCHTVFAFSGGAEETKDTLPPAPSAKQWKLVWNDEFVGDRLDESKWDVPPDGKRRDGWWMRKAIQLDDNGHLVIQTFKEDGKYIDGCVRTIKKFEHSFGYYVARIKLQNQPGHWSAFWLMGRGVTNIGNEGRDGTEIDIMEKPWLDDRVQHALHWDGYGKEHKSKSKVAKVPGVTQGFHTFALWWKPDEYVLYVDGKETWRTNAGGVCQVPLYIKLSDEVGDWGGDIGKANLPDRFLVDYVRVYDLVELSGQQGD